MPDLQGRVTSSAPGLRPQNRQQHQQDGSQRFRELPGQPSAGDVLILRRPSVPDVPATEARASPSADKVARKHGCHNRPPLASTIDVQDGWHGGKRVMDTLPTKWEQRCAYTVDNAGDAQCVGCRWQAIPHK